MYPDGGMTDGAGTVLKGPSPMTPLPSADVQGRVQRSEAGKGSPTPEVVCAWSACTGRDCCLRLLDHL